MKFNATALIGTTLFLAITFAHGATKMGAEPGIEDFENDPPPAYITTTQNGFLERSDVKTQHGRHALKWRWDGTSFLDIDAQPFIASTGTPPTHFLVWVYGDHPNGALDIQWGSRARVDAGSAQQIRYELNFSGWRSLWIQLESDGERADIEPSDLQVMRFKPTAAQGAVYFDLLEFTRSPILHGRLGSDQMPFVVNDPTNRHNYPWIARQYPRTAPLPEASSENLRHYQRIETSIQQALKQIKLANSKKAADNYKVLEQKVRIQNGKAFGAHVSSHIVDRYYRDKGMEGIHIKDIQGGLYHVAKKFEETGAPQWKERYFQYLDFLHDKGFADGSAMMNLVFVAKNAGNYLASLLIMRPHFDAATWAREAATVRWISGGNNLYNPAKHPVDADKILGDLQTMLIAIHLQPGETSAQKLSKLDDYIQLSEIIDLTMEPGVQTADRLTRIVMPDLSVCHHNQEMIFSYGYTAAESYFMFHYIFREGPAQLDPQVARGLIDLYPTFLTQNGFAPIMGARGANASSGQNYFRILNFAAASGFNQAKRWLKYYYTTGAINDGDLFLDNRKNVIEDTAIKSMDHLSGNWVQPFAATQVHRRGDWMATIRGMNLNTPSPEMFGNPNKENCANVFGDQQGYGFLQLISNDGVTASGFDLNQGGWDWSLYPGATTVRLSHATLKDVMNTNKVRFNQRTLCGGLSHFNNNGLFYQRLYAEPDSLLAIIDGHKTYFFFDDVIICLGSNLSVEGVDESMATTLFQHGHADQASPTPVLISERDASGAVNTIDTDLAERHVGDGAVNIMAPAGHVYHIPAHNRIVLRRGVQHSSEHRIPFKKNSGYYSTAWLDHGTQPQAAEYEYAVKVFAGRPRLHDFTKQGLYEVLQKNDAAHIVHYLPDDTHAYVFIKPTASNAHGPVRAVDQPLTLMTTRDGAQLNLSIADPDPNVLPLADETLDRLSAQERAAVNRGDRSILHRVVIRGEWRHITCKNPDAIYSTTFVAGNTQLNVRLLNGISLDFVLKN